MARQPGTIAFADDDRAGQRPLEAGEHVDQRRLAGAVRADQAEDLAALSRMLTSSTATQAAEPDGHTLRLKGHG